MSIGHIQMDRLQVSQFIELMVGFRPVGISGNGEEITEPVCPEMRAFIIALIGEKTPWSGHTMFRRKDEMRAMAAVLRSVADNLDNFIIEDKT